MLSLLWLLEAIFLGVLLVCRFTDLNAIRPVWVRVLLIFGAGAAGGMGLASCLFFLVGVLLRAPLAAMLLELGITAWAGYEAFRRRIPLLRSKERAGLPLLFTLTAGSLVLAVGIATVAMWAAWEANPHGSWDAWAIWNLRARFLASDAGLAQRAWSPVLRATTQAQYPLLISSFVGRTWAFGRSLDTAVPAATSYVFFLALIALAGGGVAALRGPTLGVLMALSLAATPSLLHEVPAQYADVPLACYFVGALVFALLDRPVLAGIFAGFAAWTKDEGLLFLVLLLVATAVFRRRDARAVIAGALPCAALVIFFKASAAGANASLLSTSLPGAFHRITDLARYGTVIIAFGREFLAMGSGLYHPILPLIVLAVALRFDRERRREMIFCAGILTVLLLGYFGVYIFTANDLTWELQSSLTRLFVQVWPALVLTGFLGLHSPEASVIVKPVPAAKARKARR